MKRSGFKPKTIEEVREKQAIKREKDKLKPRTTLKRSKINSKPFKSPEAIQTRKRTKAAAKRRRNGQWSTTTADNYFSKWIRERDGKCLRCHTTEGLTCSHYHKRAISITRYCPINCITLCGACHAEWEGPKEGYTDFMIQMLGADGYIELKRKSGRFMERKQAVAECKLLIKP